MFGLAIFYFQIVILSVCYSCVIVFTLLISSIYLVRSWWCRKGGACQSTQSPKSLGLRIVKSSQ